ncbi:UDP-N-acetylglucosamine 1-carboxyvinyltransferase [Phenylobacterium sp.]|uniref:UDP-N-acetylglucosamine 1-carboxyvinyltransferase n=1 Tax=Phenylobacterium sp. TaxID=1871053 RepID=UPI00356AC143
MASLVVNGGRRLEGRITPSANKNAVLPALCASLLTREPVVLHGVPDVTDVRKLLAFFEGLGSEVEADFSSGVVRLVHGSGLDPAAARLPSGMRSTVMLIPGLLRRFGEAVLEDDAKGCTLGVREIDPHLEIFRAFGARVSAEPRGLVIAAPKVFAPVRHWFDYASVTGTENFLMCAAMAAGSSRLVNAACEPHVQEFCEILGAMGVSVRGVGASTLEVAGRPELGGATHTFAEDFHETATFLALGAITGGAVEVRNGAPEQFALIDRTFAKFGVEVTHLGGWSRVRAGSVLKVRPAFTPHLLPKVEAAPWPYVPADLLPIFIALGARAEGSVMFWNKVYEGALGWTSELSKFGAHAVSCDPHRIITYGGAPLSPAEVESPYIIRAAIALLMLAASVEGRSVIRNADPINRAHPRFVENLKSLGADVEWAA